MKKSLALVLCILTLLTSLSACAKAESGGNSATGDVQSETAAQSETETTDTTEPTPAIPDGLEFGGDDFTILITGNTENSWKKNDFKADEQTGEILNDARYMRNAAVEERLGVKIKTLEEYGSAKGAGSGYTLITKSVLAADAAYDAGMIAGYDVCNLACAGYLCDLNALPYLDLTMPWWDQKANADMMIKDHMFFTTGDISTADNDATCCIIFNKKLIGDFSLDNPYDLVNGGQWTFDNMTAMAKPVASDLNGDGKYDKNDRFGVIVWDDSIMAAVNGCQIKCGTINSDGELELTLYSDRLIGIIEKYTTYIYDKELAYTYQRVNYDITDPVNMFANDQSLFFMQLLDLTSYFRDMQTDFGILPYPKYDETQESYGSTIGSWHSVFLCAPYVIESQEKTGAVLELLAAESLDKVTPAYYDKTLIGKYFRDEESVAMLDIILSNRVYDLGWYYQLGLYNDEILYLVYETDTDFASRYAKYETKAIEDVKKINDTFSQTLGK